MGQFLAGMIAMTFFVAGVFFLRFWRDTRDPLFGFFATAFLLLGVNRAALEYVGNTGEGTLYLYLVRLLAFCLIIVAIVNKNRARKTANSTQSAAAAK